LYDAVKHFLLDDFLPFLLFLVGGVLMGIMLYGYISQGSKVEQLKG
jgi:hypothetical protein